MKPPLISIAIRTFNQEKYISDALDGIIKQKINYPYEIVISDDCSTDNTLHIVSKYQKDNAIRIVASKENKGSTYNLYQSIVSCKGEYIALCDGDDYWVDEYKLQKQFDLFQKNQDCKFTFTNCLIQDGEQIKKDRVHQLPMYFSLDQLLRENIMPRTSSIIFKKDILPEKFPDFFFNLKLKNDWALMFILGQDILMSYIEDETCVYREGIGITASTKVIDIFKNGLYANKNIDEYTNFRFHYFLKNKECHYENITYYYLHNRPKYLHAFMYFFLKVVDSLRYNPTKIISSNYNFIKHCLKLTFRHHVKND